MKMIFVEAEYWQESETIGFKKILLNIDDISYAREFVIVQAVSNEKFERVPTHVIVKTGKPTEYVYIKSDEATHKEIYQTNIYLKSGQQLTINITLAELEALIKNA